MNKKLLFGTLLAVCSILFAATFTACTEEQNEPTAAANVNFSLRKAQAAQASGDGTGTNLLVYAVYDKAGNLLENLGGKNENAFATALTEKVSLKLTKGQTYTVVFWAQNSDCKAYDYSNLEAITIDYTNVTQNSEVFDAFFGSTTFTITEDFGETVELHRPFAQLNFGIPAEDLEYAAAEGLEISASSVEVSEVATILNAKTGDVSGEQAVAFAAATLPTTTLTIKVDGKDSTYAHLSMNYLLAYDVTAGGTASTTADVKFVFTTNKDAINVESAATPLQRNWRTNIISSIRNMADFDVVIDPDFGGENVDGIAYPVELNGVYYTTIETALAVAVDGDTINIAAGEHDLPNNIALKDGAEGTITFVGAGTETILAGCSEGNSGKTAIIMQNLTYKPANVYPAAINHAKSIDFEDCTIIGEYYAQSYAPHTFTNCTIDPLTGYIYTYGANCTFDNCTFNSSEGKALQVYAEAADRESTVNINNCTFTAAKQAQTWDGKPVTAIDINSTGANKFYVNINNTTATGYATGLYSGSDLWNIKGGEENVIVTIDGARVIADGVSLDSDGTYLLTKAAGLVWANENLFATSGNTYKLTANIDMQGIEWTSKIGSNVDFTFDGNGKTISNWTTAERALLVPHSTYDFTIKNLTLKDCEVNNPTTHATGNDGTGLFVGFADANNYVVLEDCHIINGKVNGFNWTGGFVGYSSSIALTIQDCSVEGATITGGGSTGAFAGHVVGGGAATTADLTNVIVKNSAITGEKAEKTGAIVGTAHVGTTTITTSDVSGNTLLGKASNKPVGRVVTGVCYLNGAQYIAEGVTVANNIYSISAPQGLAYASTNLFAKGGTFDITADLDMTDVAYMTLDNKNATNRKAMTINGNNHTISNLKIEGGQYGAFIGYASTTININDLIIANSIFAADNNKDGEYASGAFCGWITEGAYVNLKNCKSINNTIGSAKYVGGLCGFVAGYNPKTITNCQVLGGTITSAYTENGTEYKGHCGGLIGGSYGGTLTDCLIQNTTITVEGPRGGAIVGSILAGENLLGAGNVVDNVTFNGTKATADNLIGAVNNPKTPTDNVTVK